MSGLTLRNDGVRRWIRGHIKGDVLTLGEVIESVALFTPPPTEIYISPMTMAKFINATPTMVPIPPSEAPTWIAHQFASGPARLDWFTSSVVPDDAYELGWPPYESLYASH